MATTVVPSVTRTRNAILGTRRECPMLGITALVSKSQFCAIHNVRSCIRRVKDFVHAVWQALVALYRLDKSFDVRLDSVVKRTRWWLWVEQRSFLTFGPCFSNEPSSSMIFSGHSANSANYGFIVLQTDITTHFWYALIFPQ